MESRSSFERLGWGVGIQAYRGQGLAISPANDWLKK